MKALYIICYAIGCILLIISCFTVSVTLTWWLGGIAVIFLIGGCILQFNVAKKNQYVRRH